MRKSYLIDFDLSGLTVSVTGAGAGVDSVWEQEKLEARYPNYSPESLKVNIRVLFYPCGYNRHEVRLP